ncbi:MAG: tetratricopeptide repeat protein [Alphaproteobacteria bacterium]|nr:tetratricopeptide repeat protein [Alphaproteobacteria bacterium]
MTNAHVISFRSLRVLVLAGAAAVLLSACATNRASTSIDMPDYSGLSQAQTQEAVVQLGARYKANPRDTNAAIHFAAALRAAGQPVQAVAVMEQAMAVDGNTATVRIAYAKALAANGQFEQALNVVDGTLDPTRPDWNALSVKGAILDQMGQNEEARALYRQAQVTAPHEASLEANLGLSFAMTNDLAQAETHLRRAVSMPSATSQIRQNLALIVGLQGRFDEARALYARELPPDQVENNMNYIRALITQQNRWQVIEGAN